MHNLVRKRRISLLLGVGGVCALIAAIFAVRYIINARAIETEFCPVVERYFVVKQRALASLDTNGLENVMSDYAYLEATESIFARKRDGVPPRYFKTAIQTCEYWEAQEGTIRLFVGHSDTYYESPPEMGGVAKIPTRHYGLVFVLTKIEGVWKVSNIESPPHW